MECIWVCKCLAIYREEIETITVYLACICIRKPRKYCTWSKLHGEPNTRNKRWNRNIKFSSEVSIT